MGWTYIRSYTDDRIGNDGDELQGEPRFDLDCFGCVVLVERLPVERRKCPRLAGVGRVGNRMEAFIFLADCFRTEAEIIQREENRKHPPAAADKPTI